MRPSRPFPLCTLVLIGVNMAAAFAALARPELIDAYGFYSRDPWTWNLLAALFLHSNTLHLLGNMVFLAAAGPPLEAALGFWRFALLFLAGGVGGELAHMLLQPASNALNAPPLVGASGALAACVGYAVVRFGHRRVPLAPSIKVSVFTVASVWLVLQVVGGFVRVGGSEGGVAYWAHVGGFLTGLVLSLVFRAGADASSEAARSLWSEAERMGPAARLAVAQTVLRSDPANQAALRAQAGARRELGDSDAYLDSMRKALVGAPGEAVAELAAELRDERILNELSPQEKEALAERVRAQDPQLAKDLLASALEGQVGDRRADTLLALASLTEDSEERKKWLDRLLREHSLHPAVEIARARGLLN